MSNYEGLHAWKKAVELVTNIYFLTKKYPKEEIYGLTSQTRRAAVSIPSNIAEGMGRQYKNETVHFLFIARGSLYEVQTLVYLAKTINLLSASELDALSINIENTLRLLNGLINYIQNSSLK